MVSLSKRLSRLTAVIIMLAMLIPMVQLMHTENAVASGTYTLDVGDTKTLYPNTQGRVVTSGAWKSSHPFDVEIDSPANSTSSCRIKINNTIGNTTAVISFEYSYWLDTGVGYEYLAKGYDDFMINVNPVNPTGVSISQSSASLYPGETIQLSASVQPDKADQSVTWSSGNYSIASVSSSGYVTGKDGGTTTITATTSNGKSASCYVTVEYPDLSLSGVTPKNEATEQSVSSPIKFTYNTAINEGADYNSITLKDNTTGETESITKSISGSTLTITPTLKLRSGHSYTATVPAGALKNLADTSLAAASSTTFTTKAAYALEITPESGAENVDVTTPVTIKYSENIQKGTAWNTITLKNKISGEAFPSAASISGDTLTVKPNANLRYSTQYELTVPAGAIANSEGIGTGAALTTAFKTKPGSLKPVSALPENNSTKQSLSVIPQLTYGYDIKKGGSFDKITLKNTYSDKVVTGSASINDKTVIFTPTEELEYDTVYALYVPDGALVNTADEGNGEYTLRFKTVRADEATVEPPMVFWKNGQATITGAEDGASIYYTVNGDNPAINGELYTGPFEAADGRLVRAIAVLNGSVSEEAAVAGDDLLVTSKKNFGGADRDCFTGITAVENGFVAVGYSYPSSFGTGDWSETNGKGSNDAIIVKYDNEGNEVWKKIFGGAGSDVFIGITAVENGFIAVGYSEKASFGTGDWSETNGKGRDDAIIVKYDNDGNVVWKKNFGGTSEDQFDSIIAVENGFIAAGHSDVSSFGTGDWRWDKGNGSDDAIIVKYDNDGNVVWEENFGGAAYDEFGGIIAAKDGFIAVGYSYTGSFGNYDWSGIRGNGYVDAIIVKYDNKGNVVWKKNFGGADSDCFNGITAAEDGFIVVGYFGDDAVIVKYDNDGNVVWKTNSGGAARDYFNGIAAASHGFIAVGYSEEASFGTGDWSGINGKGRNDAIIVKYDNDGNMVWKTNFGSADSDYFNGVTAAEGGCIAVGGSDSFGAGDWSEISGQGGTDAIIVRFGEKLSEANTDYDYTPALQTLNLDGRDSATAGAELTETLYFTPDADTAAVNVKLTYPAILTYNGFESEYNNLYVTEKTAGGEKQLTISCDFSADNPTLAANKLCVLAKLSFSVPDDCAEGSYGFGFTESDCFTLDTSYKQKSFTELSGSKFEVISPSLKELFIIGIDEIYGEYKYTAAAFPKVDVADLQWSVSDEAVASIDQNGKLTPHKNGSVEITASAGNGITDSRTVKVSGIKSYITAFESNTGVWAREYAANQLDRELYVPDNTTGIELTVSYSGGFVRSDYGMFYNGIAKEIDIPSLPQTIALTKTADDYTDAVYNITVMTKPVVAPTAAPSETEEPSETAEPVETPTEAPSQTAAPKCVTVDYRNGNAYVSSSEAVSGAAVIFAAYRGDELISVSIADNTDITSSETEIEPDESFRAASETADKIRVFVWNGIRTMNPLALAKTVETAK